MSPRPRLEHAATREFIQVENDPGEEINVPLSAFRLLKGHPRVMAHGLRLPSAPARPSANVI
jgi:hypothetical protein